MDIAVRGLGRSIERAPSIEEPGLQETLDERPGGKDGFRDLATVRFVEYQLSRFTAAGEQSMWRRHYGASLPPAGIIQTLRHGARPQQGQALSTFGDYEGLAASSRVLQKALISRSTNLIFLHEIKTIADHYLGDQRTRSGALRKISQVLQPVHPDRLQGLRGWVDSTGPLRRMAGGHWRMTDETDVMRGAYRYILVMFFLRQLFLDEQLGRAIVSERVRRAPELTAADVAQDIFKLPRLCASQLCRLTRGVWLSCAALLGLFYQNRKSSTLPATTGRDVNY